MALKRILSIKSGGMFLSAKKLPVSLSGGSNKFLSSPKNLPKNILNLDLREQLIKNLLSVRRRARRNNICNSLKR